MTIKERIVDELRGIEFGNDFLQLVGNKWIDEMEENNDEEYILGEIKDVTKYGAATFGVSFIIHTADNEKFIKENLSDMFEFLEYYKYNFGIEIKDVNADNIMFTAVEMCASIIDNEISLSLDYYKDEDEEIKTEELTAMEITGYDANFIKKMEVTK